MGIHLGLSQEITAVHKAETDCLPLKFIRRRTLQNDKRIVLVRGMSPKAPNRLDPIFQMSCPQMSLSCPRSRKLHPLIVMIRQIHTKAHSGCQVKSLISIVGKRNTPCNNSLRRKYGVHQPYLQPRNFIPKAKNQCFRLFFIFRINCRKPRKRRLSFLNLIVFIAQIQDPAAVFLQNVYRRHAVIPAPIDSVFLFQMFQ